MDSCQYSFLSRTVVKVGKFTYVNHISKDILAQSEHTKLTLIIAVIINWTLSGNSRHSLNISILYFEKESPLDQNSRLSD